MAATNCAARRGRGPSVFRSSIHDTPARSRAPTGMSQSAQAVVVPGNTRLATSHIGNRAASRPMPPPRGVGVS